MHENTRIDELRFTVEVRIVMGLGNQKVPLLGESIWVSTISFNLHSLHSGNPPIYTNFFHVINATVVFGGQ